MAPFQPDGSTDMHEQRMRQKGAARAVSAPGERCRSVLIVLRRIIRSVDLQSRHVARTVGLTIPQLIVLQAVRDLGEVTSTCFRRMCRSARRR